MDEKRVPNFNNYQCRGCIQMGVKTPWACNPFELLSGGMTSPCPYGKKIVTKYGPNHHDPECIICLKIEPILEQKGLPDHCGPVGTLDYPCSHAVKGEVEE